MAKNAIRNLIFSFVIILLCSCSTSPTFRRKKIEKIIQGICRDEFGLKVKVLEIDETIWIYAPFENIISKNGGVNKKIQDNIRHIFLSLRRVLLSMDKPPSFYAFVASNIKDTGIDFYQIGFVPDIIKSELQFLSHHELEERIVYTYFDNPDALGDKEGRHIEMFNITIGDFITKLILQKISKTFYKEKIKEFIRINDIGGEYKINYVRKEANSDKKNLYGTISIVIDIKTKKENESIPKPFEETKRVITKFLKIYKEFSSGIIMVEIYDKSKDKKRSYTPASLLETKCW